MMLVGMATADQLHRMLARFLGPKTATALLDRIGSGGSATAVKHQISLAEADWTVDPDEFEFASGVIRHAGVSEGALNGVMFGPSVAGIPIAVEATFALQPGNDGSIVQIGAAAGVSSAEVNDWSPLVGFTAVPVSDGDVYPAPFGFTLIARQGVVDNASYVDLPGVTLDPGDPHTMRITAVAPGVQWDVDGEFVNVGGYPTSASIGTYGWHYAGAQLNGNVELRALTIWTVSPLV